jgi:hypothetical protein
MAMGGRWGRRFARGVGGDRDPGSPVGLSKARGATVDRGAAPDHGVLLGLLLPLTVLENFLRLNYDPGHAYSEGFLAHYVRPCADLRRWGPPLAWGVRVWAGLWVVVYAFLWGRERVRPR